MKGLIIFAALISLTFASYEGVSLSDDDKGYVEVTIDGDQGYVCGGFNDDVADVICRSLGYDGGSVASDSEVDDLDSADDDTDVLIQDVDCDGDEGNLGDCQYDEFDKDKDDCDDIGAVVCDGDSIEVKFKDGGAPWKGRLEVTYKKDFGYVCDSNFGDEEAEVVCAMLGFKGGRLASDAEAVSFNIGDQTVLDADTHLDNVVCTGSEDNIASCCHSGWGNTDCDLDEIVGVICDAPVTVAPTVAAAPTAPPTVAPPAPTSAAPAPKSTAQPPAPKSTAQPPAPKSTASPPAAPKSTASPPPAPKSTAQSPPAPKSTAQPPAPKSTVLSPPAPKSTAAPPPAPKSTAPPPAPKSTAPPPAPKSTAPPPAPKSTAPPAPAPTTP